MVPDRERPGRLGCRALRARGGLGVRPSNAAAGAQRSLLDRKRLGKPVMAATASRPWNSMSLQGAVDRRHRGVQQLGDLVGPPFEHLTQHEHGTLGGRQKLQCRHERQRHRLTTFGRRGRIRLDRQGVEQAV